jgi:5-methylcytosine-specific restriction endonuclease McrA
MARWISAELRQTIADRANHLCEYCLIAEADTFYGCEVDHIISLKHGGSSDPDNLAFACALCNRAKGSDVGSIAKPGDFIRFFNPAPIVGSITFV